MADRAELRGVGDDPRVGGVYAVDVRVDLADFGVQRRSHCDRGQVGRAPAERRDVKLGIDALEPGNNDDLPAVQLPTDGACVDVLNPRPRVGAVGHDSDLPAGERDGRVPHRVERDAHQRDRHLLAGRDEHVELPRVGLRRDAPGEGDQLIGHPRACGEGHDDLVAAFLRPDDLGGRLLDAFRIRDRRAAELLHDDAQASLLLLTQ